MQLVVNKFVKCTLYREFKTRFSFSTMESTVLWKQSLYLPKWERTNINIQKSNSLEKDVLHSKFLCKVEIS